jgi:hypothetical protein
MSADLTCRQCGQIDQVRHVPEEYRRSLSTSQLSGRQQMHTGTTVIIGSFGGTMRTTTPLTRLLAPPSLPALPLPSLLLALLILIFLMDLADMFSKDPNGSVAVHIGGLVLFGGLPILWLIQFFRTAWARRARRPWIGPASRLWQQCWYCGRCGRAFIRGERQLLPAGPIAPTLFKRAMAVKPR